MPGLWSVHDNPSSRLCRIPLPPLPHLGPKARDFGVYTSGALFALGWWVFLDVAIYSKAANGGDVHVQFVDWIPLICNIVGMLVYLHPPLLTLTTLVCAVWGLILVRINSIDKTRLSGDSYSYSGNGVAWKARVILFVGFAFMAGGLAGSVTVLVLKYLVHHYPFPTLGFGVSNVVANGLIMLSSVVLWIAQNVAEDEYAYNLQI